MAEFKPIRRTDGYLPIADHGLIGDGTTAALVGRDGAISWMCVPRFDSPPLFCALLDVNRGGAFTVAPEGLTESRQYYERHSGVLVTEMRSACGLVRVTDALTLRSGADLSEDVPAGRAELLRSVAVLDGRVRLRVDIEPRGGAQAEPLGEGLLIRSLSRPDIELHLGATRREALRGTRNSLELAGGERLDLILRWGKTLSGHSLIHPDECMAATIEAWHRWLRQFSYDGPEEPLVRRSAIALKLLDYTANGAIVAAPTSSLPEAIGGPRNWDYRYAWIRDAAFSVYALRRIGFTVEAARFLGWVLDAVERGARPRVLYNLDGEQPQSEWEDGGLEGYRRSAPVRWGNGAAEQWQHDVYGEILDCAHQWIAHGGTIDATLWRRLKIFVDSACSEWRAPDHGIWEVRTAGRTFTYSAALCQVALDRGARMASRFGLSGDVAAWQAASAQIKNAILERAWDEKMQSLTEHLGGGGLDASLLSLPLRRVIPADHPRMIATAAAIAERLGAGKGLLYRYLPEVSPDGLAGHEGAFLLCSFWLVDNLAHQGRLGEALDLYSSLCARAGTLGLLPEEIDPNSGAFLGNYPQAFSHIGVISSGVNLSRRLNQERNR
ncbi:MAG TPA: glycoside hydrolase family 15 protein [Candidatus Binatia bacterium]|nr:glycoside hydrolase family 15 protein [Candidatus Binatia bacterium]